MHFVTFLFLLTYGCWSALNNIRSVNLVLSQRQRRIFVNSSNEFTMAAAHTPLLIEGLSAFPITPQDAAGVVDEAQLLVLVQRLIDAGVHSIGLLGSTGTYAFLDVTQRRRAIAVAAAAIAAARERQEQEGGGAAVETRRIPKLLVGVGHLRTDVAVQLAKDAQAAGADAGLLSPVSYNPLTDEEVFQHFAAVAAAAPSLPLVIYNNEVGWLGGCLLASCLLYTSPSPRDRG